MLGQQLRAQKSGVVEGTFDPDPADAEFARLFGQWPFDALQVFCTAPIDVLVARYAQRAPARHRGHLDAAIGEDVQRDLERGRWRPLSLPGELVMVDTGRGVPVDLDPIVRAAAVHLQPG